ncbi:MAG: PIG-L family deacetylase [Candidatus Eisenbacteria bacterium]|uniref:PIG-L family deacetylase n=1 Tax=Eiseniibacteriota bacterium TaxID=2212470 RepID=A0A538SS01_UNCEI|nr:MAG: PIG-L family deacetylase [Candidatus Eisenbacteria bacterium]
MIDIRERLTSNERIMVIAPHPDDESIATGGVLLHAVSVHAPVRVLYMTDGEDNPWAQRATEGNWRITSDDRLRWGARRRSEALDALACLGIPPEAVGFLQFADQRLTSLLGEGAGEPARRLAEEIASWKPTALFVPSLEDRHPDHSATSVIAQLALARRECDAQPQVFTYTVHAPQGYERRGRLLVLSRPERDAKEQAILCHASQLKLRRRFLLRFLEEPERFELGQPAAVAADATHPLRLLRANCEEWSFAVRDSFRLAVDRATLFLISQGDGEVNSISLRIRYRDGRAPLFHPNGGDVIGEVTTRKNGSHLEVTIASPRLRHANLRLAKVELWWDRRLWFFDRWPWLSFGLLARPVTPIRSESEDRVRSYAER